MKLVNISNVFTQSCAPKCGPKSGTSRSQRGDFPGGFNNLLIYKKSITVFTYIQLVNLYGRLKL